MVARLQIRDAGPKLATTPEASWPSAIGMGRGRSPLMPERSEWQTPAAAIFTSTSPGPGFARFTDSIARGRDCA